jgi:hypothetical protein
MLAQLDEFYLLLVWQGGQNKFSYGEALPDIQTLTFHITTVPEMVPLSRA